MAKELASEELLQKVEEAGSKCERELHGCGRCTLAALMQCFGLADKASTDLVLKAALPLSGGIAQTRNTCGALLGGLMGIGMVFFAGKLEDAEAKDIQAVMALGRRYYRRFEKEIGNVRCFDIRQVGLGRSFSDPDQYEAFVKAGGYDLCASVCGKAARLAAEFILEVEEERAKGA